MQKVLTFFSKVSESDQTIVTIFTTIIIVVRVVSTDLPGSLLPNNQSPLYRLSTITTYHHHHQKKDYVQAMIPAMGLKFLRDSTDSANLLAMESVMMMIWSQILMIDIDKC